jgi:hypothetical protein
LNQGFLSRTVLIRSRDLLSDPLKEASEEKALRFSRLCQCSISTSTVEAKICLQEKSKPWKKPRTNSGAFLEDLKSNKRKKVSSQNIHFYGTR